MARLSVCLLVRLYVRPCVCLAARLCALVCAPVCLSVCLCACATVCLCRLYAARCVPMALLVPLAAAAAKARVGADTNGLQFTAHYSELLLCSAIARHRFFCYCFLQRTVHTRPNTQTTFSIVAGALPDGYVFVAAHSLAVRVSSLLPSQAA